MITNLSDYTTTLPNGGTLLSTEPTPNGNMLNATAQLLLLGTDQDLSTYVLGIGACSVKQGLYSRYPTSLENTSIDDYLALGCLPGYSHEILAYGRDHFGFFDILYPNPSLSQWLFRFQGMWQTLKITSKSFVGPLGRLIWAGSMVYAAHQPFSNQDSWIQSHMMVIAYRRSGLKSFICDLAIKYWLNKRGDMTTSEIMHAYTGIADHPLVQAWEAYK